MKMLKLSTIAIGFGLMTMSVRAMPVFPVGKSAPSEVIQVAQGCGPGFHRGPRGACRPLYNCPRGWHTGPFGRRCTRNW
jgi:hypothetical protein